MKANVKKIGKNDCIGIKTLKGDDYGEIRISAIGLNRQCVYTEALIYSDFDVFKELSNEITKLIDTWFTETDDKIEALNVVVYEILKDAYIMDDDNDSRYSHNEIGNNEIDIFREGNILAIIFKKIG